MYEREQTCRRFAEIGAEPLSGSGFEGETNNTDTADNERDKTEDSVNEHGPN
jgi:hypothetical protein